MIKRHVHRANGRYANDGSAPPRKENKSTYSTWASMKNRCSNPSNPKYPNYGGRGIRVCERWLSFDNFLSDMGPRPSQSHSIDRFPDNNGNYEPGNCRWATPIEQARNMRTNLPMYVYHGKSMTLRDWASVLGVKYNMLYSRLRSGMTFEMAVTTPIKGSLVRGIKKRQIVCPF